MKQNIRGVGIGTPSLVMILAVLCLTVFAVLTLSTANVESALVERRAAFVAGYYEADTKATIIRAQILENAGNGLFPDMIDGVDVAYEDSPDGILVTYTIEVNDVLDLFVKLRIFDHRDVVLEWRTVYSQDWEADDSIEVWDGEI